MFSGNYMTSTFKRELLEGVHDFKTHVFKLALYGNDATLTADTETYVETGEVVGSGYTSGGADLVTVGPSLDGVSAIVTFSDVSWPVSTITARGALVYNSSVSGSPAVAVLDFGSDKVSTETTFTVNFPAATSTTAVIRIT